MAQPPDCTAPRSRSSHAQSAPTHPGPHPRRLLRGGSRCCPGRRPALLGAPRGDAARGRHPRRRQHLALLPRRRSRVRGRARTQRRARQRRLRDGLRRHRRRRHDVRLVVGDGRRPGRVDDQLGGPVLVGRHVGGRGRLRGPRRERRRAGAGQDGRRLPDRQRRRAADRDGRRQPLPRLRRHHLAAGRERHADADGRRRAGGHGHRALRRLGADRRLRGPDQGLPAGQRLRRPADRPDRAVAVLVDRAVPGAVDRHALRQDRAGRLRRRREGRQRDRDVQRLQRGRRPEPDQQRHELDDHVERRPPDGEEPGLPQPARRRHRRGRRRRRDHRQPDRGDHGPLVDHGPVPAGRDLPGLRRGPGAQHGRLPRCRAPPATTSRSARRSARGPARRR